MNTTVILTYNPTLEFYTFKYRNDRYTLCREGLKKFFRLPTDPATPLHLVLSTKPSPDAYHVNFDGKGFHKPVVVTGNRKYRPAFPTSVDAFTEDYGPFYASIEYEE